MIMSFCHLLLTLLHFISSHRIHYLSLEWAFKKKLFIVIIIVIVIFIIILW
jgi:hypothetical protein